MSWRRFSGAALTVICLAGPAAAATTEGEAMLEPYQMVRSLQLVQDRIAAGDHAALPMQRKLLEMIDQRFRDTSSGDYIDKRNFQALLVYAMSGGNPNTINALLARLHLDETDRMLGAGIVGYLDGDMTLARESLAMVDPLELTPEVGAFFALVKGSITAADAPGPAMKMFDQARLLSPGTLVEEAALRRSIALASGNQDTQHFLQSSSQYVRRFLHSPYASQFVDGFVAGVITLNATIDLASVEDIVSGMDPERRKIVYLRLARRAALDGIAPLTQYASAKADSIRLDNVDANSDPRALLYSSLATVTSGTVDQVLPKLKNIDRSRLSESDRRLLAAVEAIATEVTARPGPVEVVPAKSPDERPVEASDMAAGAEDDLPEAEPLDTPMSPVPAAAAAEHAAAPSTAPAAGDATHPAIAAEEAQPVENGHEPAQAAEAGAHTEPAQAGASDAPDATAAVVTDARKKLEEIDKLLKETAQ